MHASLRLFMCGRYTNTVSIKKLAERFGFKTIEDDFRPRYNIAPGQIAPVVLRNSPNRVEWMRWGLVPAWAKEEKIGYKMINARAETLGSKPSFKRPFQRHRCLVLADSFYEWKTRTGTKEKIPMRIFLRGGIPFAFAGLWDHWKKPDGTDLHSFAIITTEANKKLKTIHDRMPAILKREDEASWLDPELQESTVLGKLLKPYPDPDIEFYPVSTLVNSPKNDVPDCIVKVSSDDT